mmetsp:Transcript_25902/g.65627  ORF Transcript_25902/g.65627 Transcript_25902/m.65627 type:complete len:1566 (-) Transcript_25902:377-5074(-)
MSEERSLEPGDAVDASAISVAPRSEVPVSVQVRPRTMAKTMPFRKARLLIIATLVVTMAASGVAIAGLILAVQGRDNLEAENVARFQGDSRLNSSAAAARSSLQNALNVERVARVAGHEQLNITMHASKLELASSIDEEKQKRMENSAILNATIASESALHKSALENAQAASHAADVAINDTLLAAQHRLAVLECAQSSCSGHGSCSQDLTTCTCNTGFSGSSCDSCETGYFGSACLPCASCGSHGSCDDGMTGSGRCNCDSGWRGGECQECASGYYGASCSACSDCGSNGLCIDGMAGSGNCLCLAGWRGSNCSLCAKDYYGSSCVPCSCNGRGTCNDGLTGTGCMCNSGFGGDHCEDCMTGYYGSTCAACSSCQPHSTCDDGMTGSGTCVCDDGWASPNCDACVSLHFGANCSACPSCDHGSCDEGLTGNGQCNCDAGWSGALCDACASGFYGASCDACPSCGNGACNEGLSGDGLCTCNAGWTGAACDSCLTDYYGSSCSACPSCGTHGSCSDGITGNGTCICATGWSGTSCDVCADGYFGSTCAACPTPCGGHAVCNDGLTGDGTCVCDLGWTGAACDSCLTDYFGASCTACSCSAHGTCFDGLSGNGTCACEVGWAGAICDECASDYYGPTCSPCGSCTGNTRCNDTLVGDGTCVCQAGWSGPACNESTSGNFPLGTATPGSVLYNPNGGMDANAVKLGSGGVSFGGGDLMLAASAPYLTTGSKVYRGALYLWQRANLTESIASVAPKQILDPLGEGGTSGFIGVENADELGKGGITISDDGLTMAAGEKGAKVGVSSSAGVVVVWHRSSMDEDFADHNVERLPPAIVSASSMLGATGVSMSSDSLILVACQTSMYVLTWTRPSTSAFFNSTTPEVLSSPLPAFNSYFGVYGATISGDGLVLAVSHQAEKSAFVFTRSSTNVRWNETKYEVITDSDAVIASGGQKFSSVDICLSADGTLLVTYSPRSVSDGVIYAVERTDTTSLFNASTPAFLTLTSGGDIPVMDSIALSRDALIIATPNPSSNYVLLWRRASTSVSFAGVVADVMRAPKSHMALQNIAFSSDGYLLAAGSQYISVVGVEDGGVVLFGQGCPDGQTGDQCEQCLPGYFGASCSACPTCSGHTECDDGKSGSGQCVCLPGWGGTGCLTSLVFAESMLAPLSDSSQNFGAGGVSLSADGLTFAAAAGEAGLDVGGAGIVYVWERASVNDDFNASTPAVFNASNSVYYEKLGGSGVTLSPDGLLLVASIYNSRGLVWERATRSDDFALTCTVTDLGLGKDYGTTFAVSGNRLFLATGAPQTSVIVSGNGAVYVYQRATTSDIFEDNSRIMLTAPNADNYGGNLGNGIPAFSEDGMVLAAGAYNQRVGEKFPGVVYVWHRNTPSSNFNDSWVEKLIDPAASFDSHLGFGGVSLSSNGLVLAAGQMRTSLNGKYSGAVVVWERTSASESFNATAPTKLLDPNGKAEDELGSFSAQVSPDGNVIASSSPKKDETNTDAGAVLYWRRSGAGQSFADVIPYSLVDPNPDMSQKLGSRVGMNSDGSIVVAGAGAAQSRRGKVVFFTIAP